MSVVSNIFIMIGATLGERFLFTPSIAVCLAVPFLLNRMKEKGFARGANREAIQACVETGLTLEEFLGIALEAMQGIAAELGL